MAGMSNSNNGDVSGNHPSNSFGSLSIDLWVVKLCPDVVSLTLLSFNAVKYNNNIELKWRTASEVNTKDFAIERSTNAIDWMAIGSTNAKSEGSNDYIYYDKSPVSGINYYRLKMNDKDDKFTYSPVRTVKFSSNIGFAIIPNPSNNKTTIYFSGNVKGAEISICDIQGSTLQKHLIIDNTTPYPINSERLPAGTYLIKLQSTTGIITKKLVVSH